MLLKAKRDLITVVDAGTSKIVAITARSYEDSISVVGCSLRSSSGIRNGLVVDLKKAVNTVARAIEEVENECGERVDAAYLIVSGKDVKCENKQAEIFLGTGEIGSKDIKSLVDKGKSMCKEENGLVAPLHCLPTEYILDGSGGIANPSGMYGSSLSANMTVVTAPKNSLLNLENCLGKCHVAVAGRVAEQYALGWSVLNDDDRQLGAIVVDIGGGGSSIGIYRDGYLTATDWIPLGGVNVTKDIACAFSISIRIAEKLKILYGGMNVLPSDNNEIINCDEIFSEDRDVQGEGDFTSSATALRDIQISRSELRDVVSARMEEILEIIRDRLIGLAGLKSLSFRPVIFTGGTSKTDGLREVASEYFQSTVRIGRQNSLRYASCDLSDPIFSTAIGGLICSAHSFDTSSLVRVSGEVSDERGIGIRKWLQKYF